MTKKTAARGLLVLLLAAAIWFFRAHQLGGYFTFESLQARELELQAFREGNPALAIGGYLAIYVGVCSLSLPGAVPLTLAGGVLFGLDLGTVLVSLGSTLGATGALLISRFLLRDLIQGRYREKLARINEGIRKEGAFYLLTLRLLPVFPFFLINLAMGLTPIRVPTYFWVSLLGMLPGTVVYVNAGTQLARLHSPREILSPALLLSLLAIGVFPLLAKAGVGWFRSTRALRGFPRPRRFDYNLIVIGGGSAGLVSSYIAATVRAKVALIEKQRMGGDCLNTGCVPSKALIRSARMLSYARRAKEFGFRKTDVDFDFGEVMDRVRRVIGKIEPHDSVERYTGLGVECIRGEARVRTPYAVEVNGRTLTARALILATGASPAVPPIPGIEKIRYLTSDTVWNLRKRPERLLVLGGGPIGCELAQCFARLGSRVTIVEKAPRLLFREDEDVSAFIRARFEGEGIAVRTGHEARSFASGPGGSALVCGTPEGEVRIEFDELLVALGRKAHARGFGLEELGVELAPQGTIANDEFLRTNFPNIYVCGDVAGPYQFTHTAAHQAWYASVNALFSPFKAFRADYRVIPWTTFTDPEVARVGLSESEARERGIPFEVTRYGLEDLDRAIAEEEDHGFVKVLTEPGRDRILGAVIVGAHGGDLLAEYVLAMKHGLGLNKILGTIHTYPTFAEANKYAAGVWKKAHAPERVLACLRAFHAWRRS